jgi:hypothetical protein
MKREAKSILREELKSKGLSSDQINELFSSWNEQVDEAKAEKKDDSEDKNELRHGTTCFGIINPGKNKTVTEF